MSNHNYLPKARWQAAAGVTCSAMFCSTLLTFSGPPQWWTTRGVIQDGADENNYAAVNVGQAKWMATQAYLELSDQLAPFGGVDFTLEDIVPPVPAITVPRGEHVQIPTVRGEVTGTPRGQLAKDIRDLRNNTNAPNSSLQELIDLNKTQYPDSFSK